MFGWAFHLLWHTKGIYETSSSTKNLFSFPSLVKVRGSKSENEQEQHYHILVKLSAVIIEML